MPDRGVPACPCHVVASLKEAVSLKYWLQFRMSNGVVPCDLASELKVTQGASFAMQIIRIAAARGG